MKRIVFITYGDETTASSRLRAYWPAKYMENTTVIPASSGVQTADYDVFIFQKVASVEAFKFAKDEGKRVILDLCDPVWWFQPKEARQYLRYVDAVTFSNSELMYDFLEWAGKDAPQTHHIPDRIELSHYKHVKNHKKTSPVRLIWFGYAQNRHALLGAIPTLQRLAANGHNVQLTIFDDQPEIKWEVGIPVQHMGWSIDCENEVIADHDIALLPPFPGRWGEVKSNNKRLTAWACGLPTVTGFDYAEIEALIKSHKLRAEKVATYEQILGDNYDVQQSARQWEQVIG